MKHLLPITLMIKPTKLRALFAALMILFLSSLAVAEVPYELAWTRQLGTSGDDMSFGVATDSEGNIFTSGDIDGNTPNGIDAFVGKYDTSGNLLWTRQLGTSDYDSSRGVAVDPAGNIFIGGYTYGDLSGSNAGGTDVFVGKYDPSGNLLWTRQLGSIDYDWCRGVATDSAGNVFITGTTQGSLGGPSIGWQDAFVCKYNASGSLLWIRQFGTDEHDGGSHVAVDSAGNVFISGHTKGSLGGTNPSNWNDAFIRKYDTSGNVLWTRQLGLYYGDVANCVAVDPAGNAFICGTTMNDLDGLNAGEFDAFVSKYDTFGNLLWTRQLGSIDDDYCEGVAVDAAGNVFISGFTWDSLEGPNLGKNDAFVSKYDNFGNFLWTQQLGTSESDGSESIATDTAGNVFISGFTMGSLGGVNEGKSDIFVIKFTVPEADITTGYQVSNGADDGYARNTAEQDLTSPFLKIGDERTYTSPYQMSAMRFTNINIPRSATIISAHLKISSINTDYRGQIYGVIAAEASDNPTDFSSRLIGNAALTAASVAWDYKTAWSPDTQYISPDISNIIQEVVNRSGFDSGNSMAIYYSTRVDSGKSRKLASYEYNPTLAAVLEINYEYYTIFGYVKNSEGIGVSGVLITTDANIKETTTDVDGYYELQVPPGWSGTIMPSKIDWGFNPASQTFSNVTSDQLSPDYISFQPKISGYVKNGSGTGIEGVLVSADNGGGSDTTDATGYYEITVPYDWTGTISVSKAGWNLTPSSRPYSNVTSNQINQDYTAFQPVISGYIKDGTVTGIEGVSVSADNGGGSDTTNVTGYYEITVPYDWSGIVTPSKTGWNMTPLNRSYSNVIAGQTNEDYTAFQPKISGYVKDSNDIGVEGVLVLADNSGGSDTTDVTGYYEIAVPYNWSGTVTPSKTGWGFSPQNQGYSNVIMDQTNQDYTAFKPKISGHVTDSNGIGVSGVAISADNGGGSDTTDASGHYGIIVPYDWSGTVTVGKIWWGFDPASKSYSNLTTDQSNQDYTAFAPPVISGCVEDNSGSGLEGVSVTADNGGGSDTSDSTGYYEITVPYNWSGIVTPSKGLKLFDPLNRSYSNLATDQSEQDFVLLLLVVRADGSGNYPTIQAAIDAAVDGDEIMIEPGKYDGVGNCYIQINDKSLTLRSVDPNNLEVVSKTIIDGSWQQQGSYQTGGIYADNTNEPNSIILIEGLTVTNCDGAGIICNYGKPIIRNCVIEKNYGSPWDIGGGILCFENAPVISNCVVRRNFGGEVGTGGIAIYNSESSGNSSISNCLISNNYNYYSRRGGVDCRGANLTIRNCTISNNIAFDDYTGEPINNNIGRGVFIENSNVVIKNSIIWDNVADDGTQIAILDFSESRSPPIPAKASISYSDIKGGEEEVFIAPDYDSFIAYLRYGTPIDPNLIDPNTLNWGAGNVDVDPCFAVEPNDGGDGWLENYQTPESESVNNVYGDFHLKSKSGRFVRDDLPQTDLNKDGLVNLIDFAEFSKYWLFMTGNYPHAEFDFYQDLIINYLDLSYFVDDYLYERTLGQWVTDDVTSPCIDAGDPNSDWTAELWQHGKRINMGAYGGTPQASMSLLTVGNKTDLNNDGFVNVEDLVLFVDMWLAKEVLLSEDINRNGLVNFSDWAEFAGQWLWEE